MTLFNVSTAKFRIELFTELLSTFVKIRCSDSSRVRRTNRRNPSVEMSPTVKIEKWNKKRKEKKRKDRSGPYTGSHVASGSADVRKINVKSWICTFAFAPCASAVCSWPSCRGICCNRAPARPSFEKSLEVRPQGRLVPPSWHRDISAVRSAAAVCLKEESKTGKIKTRRLLRFSIIDRWIEFTATRFVLQVQFTAERN